VYVSVGNVEKIAVDPSVSRVVDSATDALFPAHLSSATKLLAASSHIMLSLKFPDG
jgi:hypothetical protein